MTEATHHAHVQLIYNALLVSGMQYRNLKAFCLFYFFNSLYFIIQFSQFSHSVVSNSLRPHESQRARPPCPSPTPGVHSDSRPSSQ